MVVKGYFFSLAGYLSEYFTICNLKEVRFNRSSCYHKRLRNSRLRLEVSAIVPLAQRLLFTMQHMRITLIPTTKLTFLCTALAGALLTFSNGAQALSIRDADASLGHRGRPTYVNHMTDLTGLAVRSDERFNGQSFSSGNSTRHVVLPDHMNADRSVQVITTPIISGVPSGRVPDGGITAMLLGTALGVLGIARRYIRS